MMGGKRWGRPAPDTFLLFTGLFLYLAAPVFSGGGLFTPLQPCRVYNQDHPTDGILLFPRL
jgi:hypothetical protein